MEGNAVLIGRRAAALGIIGLGIAGLGLAARRAHAGAGLALSGRFQQGGREHVQRAIAAARAAFPAWAALPWQERARLLKRVADAIRDRRWELSVWMGYEAGKNRLECVGDVEESADLIEYYCDEIQRHEGFVRELGKLSPQEQNVSGM